MGVCTSSNLAPFIRTKMFQQVVISAGRSAGLIWEIKFMMACMHVCILWTGWMLCQGRGAGVRSYTDRRACLDFKALKEEQNACTSWWSGYSDMMMMMMMIMILLLLAFFGIASRSGRTAEATAQIESRK